MTIWETDAAILGGDGEGELQQAGWEPFGFCYVPSADDPAKEGFFEVVYRRMRPPHAVNERLEAFHERELATAR